jgi:hypothetical protein
MATTMDDNEIRKQLRYAFLVDFLEIDAINKSDLSSDMADPKNAIYRVPLPGPSEEEALIIAIVNYEIVVKMHSKEPNFDDDVAYEQCLTDARRMLLDPNYRLLFDLAQDLHDIEHRPIDAIQRTAAGLTGRTVEQIACLPPHEWFQRESSSSDAVEHHSS